MEDLEVKKYYLWNSTSRKGKAEIYSAENEESLFFESGRFVSKSDFASGFLSEISQEEYAMTNSDDNSQTAPLLSDQFVDWEKMLGNPDQPPILPVIPVEANPIKLIIDKQKKKESFSLNLQIDIEIPSSKVYELLSMMFDEDEVIEEIIKSTVSKIEINDIKEKLESDIKSAIVHFYNKIKE